MSHRDSNIEFFRLLLMMMITIHHHIISLFSVPTILGTQGEVDFLHGFAIFLNAFCYVAVNCFILISGYYGIKYKNKGIVKLYLLCVFYAALRLIWQGVFHIDKTTILSLLLPVSYYTQFWFMTCYFILYLFAPFLNKAINNLSKEEFLYVLAAFTIANVHFGFFHQTYNYNGYDVSQFVYLYLIAAYIRKHINLGQYKKRFYVYAYIVFCLIFGLLSIVIHYVEIPFYRSFAYNNPFLILAAIALFCFFVNWNFQSRFINWCASSALAIYLLPEMTYREKLTQIIRNNMDDLVGVGVLLVVILLYAFTKMIIALIIDKIRLCLIEQPIIRFIDKNSNCFMQK